MAGRGVLFAIEHAEAVALKEAKKDDSDDELMEVIEEIEERWDRAFLAEADKAWDAIHRCLTDGKLEYENGTFPLNRCILGGEILTSGDDYLVILTEAGEVPVVGAALGSITEASMRQGYNKINADEYEFGISEDDFQYTWHWFQQVRSLWQRAASAGKSVIFTVDL